MQFRLPSKLEQRVPDILNVFYQENKNDIENLFSKLPTEPKEKIQQIQDTILALVDKNRTIYHYVEKYVCDSQKIRSEEFLRTVIISLMTQLTACVSQMIDNVMKVHSDDKLDTLLGLLQDLNTYLETTKTDHEAMKTALKTLQIKVPSRSVKDRLTHVFNDNVALLPDTENILTEEKLKKMINDKQNTILLKIIEGEGEWSPGRVLDKFPQPNRKSILGTGSSKEDVKLSAMDQGIALFSTSFLNQPDGMAIKFIKAYIRNAIETKNASLKISTEKRFKSEIGRITHILAVYLDYIADKTKKLSDEESEIILKNKLHRLEKKLEKYSGRNLVVMIDFLNKLEEKLKKYHLDKQSKAKKPKKSFSMSVSPRSDSSSSSSTSSSFSSLSPKSSYSRKPKLTLLSDSSFSFTNSDLSPTSLSNSPKSVVEPLSPKSPKGFHHRWKTFFIKPENKHQTPDTPKVQSSELEENLRNYIISSNEEQNSDTAPHTTLEKNKNIINYNMSGVVYDMFNMESKVGDKILVPEGCMTKFLMNYIKIGYQHQEFKNFMDGQGKIQHLQKLFIRYFEQKAAECKSQDEFQKSINFVENLLKDYENNWSAITKIIEAFEILVMNPNPLEGLSNPLGDLPEDEDSVVTRKASK